MAFNIVFFLELVLRVIADAKAFFFAEDWRWNLIDVVLVGTSLVDLFLSSLEVNFAFGSQHFRSVRLLRILRTVRLFRTLKSIREFRKMAFRIMSSVRTLVCSMVILFFIVYCYGLLLCQGVTEFRLQESYLSHENVDLETRYGSLPNTLYSLFAAVTQGKFSSRWMSMALAR